MQAEWFLGRVDLATGEGAANATRFDCHAPEVGEALGQLGGTLLPAQMECGHDDELSCCRDICEYA